MTRATRPTLLPGPTRLGPTRVSHHQPTADADLCAPPGRTPKMRLDMVRHCLRRILVRGARRDGRLNARATAGGEKLGLALLLFFLPWVVSDAEHLGDRPRLGYLVLSPLNSEPSPERQMFLGRLAELGYVDGMTIEILYRSAAWSHLPGNWSPKGSTPSSR